MIKSRLSMIFNQLFYNTGTTKIAAHHCYNQSYTNINGGFECIKYLLIVKKCAIYFTYITSLNFKILFMTASIIKMKQLKQKTLEKMT